ncbi:YqzE family protein [Cohnella sp.]|uniref:YqzE family protein n=1 Tax=Cohnella sp. TaxID=1883426 RepID=UPI0035630107
MDSSEYLKYMTERVVSYLDSNGIEEEKKSDKKISREPWLTRWFGVLPMGLMMWWGQKADKKNKTHPEVRSLDSSNYR